VFINLLLFKITSFWYVLFRYNVYFYRKLESNFIHEKTAYCTKKTVT